MDNALYMSLADQVGSSNKLKIVTNNMANAKTPGFKSDEVLFQKWLYEDANNEKHSMPVDAKTFRNETQGSLQPTSSKFDFAIIGDGFFGIIEANGEMKYTRNGRFTLNGDGMLVDIHGRAVSDLDGGAINFEPGEEMPTISKNGSMFVGTELRGNIGVFKFDSNNAIRKTIHGDYISNIQAEQMELNQINIMQGMIETSNVDPVLGLIELTDVGKRVEYSNMLMNVSRDNNKSIYRIFSKTE